MVELLKVLPEPKLLPNEVVYDISKNIKITSKGRVINDGIIKNVKSIIYNGKLKRIQHILAEALLSNPNNYKSIKFIDGNENNFLIDNLKWFDHSENYFINKTNITDLIINEYKTTLIGKATLKRKYNTPMSYIDKILKGINKEAVKPVKIKKGKKPYLCKSCGDTNSNNFKEKSKSICKKCHSQYYK
jgi:hypothetical protein